MAILNAIWNCKNYNWEFNHYNDDSLKCPTVIQSCKMYRYLSISGILLVYTSFQTRCRATQSHVCNNNNNIFIIHKIRGKCFNVYICIVKSIKGKEAPPGWHATGNKKTGSYVGWKWGFHWEVLWLRAHLCTLGPSLASPPLELLAAACTASAQLCGSCIAECILSTFLVHVWMKRVYIRNAHFKDSVAWTA